MIARGVGFVLQLAPARAGSGFGLRGGSHLRLGGLGERTLVPRRRRARASSSASMSARRFLPASRRAAPVGALAATEKPSQRQRSPSRDTRRWPGLSSCASCGASARSITPICASRRASSPRRLDVVRQRLDAFRQRRIGGIDLGAGPAHRRATDRPALRGRRRARRRARSRSPSRPEGRRAPAATDSWCRRAGAWRASSPRCRAAARGVRPRASGPRATSSAWRAAECAASARTARPPLR